MITDTSVLNTRYQLEKKVGQGGFAVVFLATDLLLERRVAIKVLNSELTDDGDFLERFSREAKAIAILDHPNILVIHDFGQAEGTAYLVTPFIDGGTLYDKMRQGKIIPPAMAARYLHQMASALDYAHRRNIVHRDIKPHNMLLRAEDNQLFLADFGIAKVLSSASSQSRTSAIGTISYMSPEQLAGNVGKATDIYALGCVLFQMLTGQVPYTGPTEQIIMGHINGEIPSVVERSHGQLDPALQEVFNRALAKRPEDRYQTAQEMSLAFDAALSGTSLTSPLPGNYTNQNARTLYAVTELEIPPVNPAAFKQDLPQSQQRAVTPPPGVAYGPPPGSNTPSYPYASQPGPSTPPFPYANPPGPAIQPAYPVRGSANPPEYTPHTAWNNGPVAPQRAKKGPNLPLIGGLGLIAAVLIIVIAVLLLSISSPKATPTQVAVVITPTSQDAVTSQTPTTTAAAAQTTAISNVSTVTPGVATTAASITTSAATTAALATTAAPTTTVVPTTAAPTTIAPTTAAPTTVAPTTALPTTAAPKITLIIDKTAINKALQSLPGSTSVYIILPDGQTIGDDADRAQPSASTIKLWIAATAYEEAKAGLLNLSEIYVIKQGDIASGTGILVNNVGKSYPYGQIISTMLTYSDNSAANLIIRKLGGYDKINSYILRNQYSATKLQRMLGNTDDPNNNFTSAKDAAIYMLHLSKGEIIDGNSSLQILNALLNRKIYSGDQNFFSTKLTDQYQKNGYVHISGTGVKVRNEIGLLPIPDSANMVIAILDTGMPDEAGAETAIASAVQVIGQSVKR